MEIKGHNGQIELLDNKIVIKRKGFLGWMGHGDKGNKDILLNKISSIQLKKADMFTNGYIQFAFTGGQESKGGVYRATLDENTVMFTKKQQSDFERLKIAIEEKMELLENPRNDNKSSDLDELEKLASLRDKGIITEEEFQAKKKQILGL